MLYEIDGRDAACYDFDQKLIVDNNEKILRLSWGINKERVAYPHGHRWELVLYTRHNDRGREEAGLIWRPNAVYIEWGRVQAEMLRLFACDDRVPLMVARKHYTAIVRQKKFREVQL